MKLETWNSLILWLSQGFGVGRLPRAPGTFGSMVGLGWLAILLWPRNPWVFLGGVLASIPVSVWISGAAERILHTTDPGSVVIDEIIAVPLCFAGWLAAVYFRQHFWPAPGVFFQDRWPATLGVFLLFRFFDVIKPWPVRQSQALRGGWGVTIDDMLAALYVNAVVLVVIALKGL